MKAMARHAGNTPSFFPIGPDPKDDELPARLDGWEDEPLHAAILMALILDNPVDALKSRGRAARDREGSTSALQGYRE